ncbi:MAG: hypothetical protein PHF57_13655 [Methanoregula sp.]|nr:hypothetical protein [Methanoregula sp.]
MAIPTPATQEIIVEIRREWESGYDENMIYFWSGEFGFFFTFSTPANTRNGQIRSGKLTPIRKTRGGTPGKKCISV